jgi:hypothetical protein
MRSVLALWRTAGIYCESPIVGMPDDLPQWHCHGDLNKENVDIIATGDDVGLVDVVIVVAGLTYSAGITEALAEAVKITPWPPGVLEEILGALANWPGPPSVVSTSISGIRMTLEADNYATSLFLSRTSRDS